jgi:histidinol-phosphate aminotransferase
VISQQDRIARWIRPDIRSLSAYHVPDPGSCIKLDAMENPYTWPQDVVGAWLERLGKAELNRYPDPEAHELKRRLREVMGFSDSAGLLLGNGSDELIQMIALAAAGAERCILAPEPTFVMYRMIAVFAGMRYVGVSLRSDDFALDMPAMRAAIDAHQPAVIFLAYPNNPTGNLFPAGDVEEIIRRAPGLVVVDEAYAAFASDSFLARLDDCDNLLLLRTVSKMGLAGLRLGMLAGPPAWLAEIDKVRLPYNINVLTQISAAFALENHAVLDAQTARIRSDREKLHAELAAMPEIEAFPSQANFILFRTPPGRASAIFDGLRSRRVLIKNMSGAGGLLSDCLRVTVGTPVENRAFLAALRACLA